MNEINGDKLTKWIDTTDFDMCKWAYRYLSDIGFLPVIDIHAGANRRSIRGEVKVFKNIQGELSSNREFMRRMYNSWRQEKHRLKNKKSYKKQYSFVLYESTNDELNEIAKEAGKSRVEALELMIAAYYDVVETKLADVEREKFWSKFTGKVLEADELKDELLELDDEMKVLKEENDSLAKELQSLKSCLNTMQLENQAKKKASKKID